MFKTTMVFFRILRVALATFRGLPKSVFPHLEEGENSLLDAVDFSSSQGMSFFIIFITELQLHKTLTKCSISKRKTKVNQ